MTSFRELHQPGNPFILANAWDMGSAKVLEAMGAVALATTSGGHAFTLGRLDMGNVTRDEALAHAQDILSATTLPVSADLENGYGGDPETVAQTIRLAGEIGLAGACIEDWDGIGAFAYDFELSVERMRAAAAAARELPDDFVLVARADGIMNGAYDTDEAIRRLQAFEQAGVDALYAPLPPDMAALKRICDSTTRPVNALCVGPFAEISRDEFAAAGVARISLGGGLARIAQGALINAARNILTDGNFSDVLSAAPGAEVDQFLLSVKSEH